MVQSIFLAMGRLFWHKPGMWTGLPGWLTSASLKTMKTFLHLLLFGAIVAALAGCSMTEKSQLANINKDWNRLIRASHIYPIYPLSEDLEPGDIFFVPTDIEDVSGWDTSGYIKLDHQIGRLYPAKYGEFYRHSFITGTNELPYFWMKDNSWTNAPLAAFPSYSFAVKQGGGANVSLPIQGVPIALGLMGAKSASGHVTIADAHTYGVDEITLQNQVEDFVTKHRSDLLDLINTQDDTNRSYFLQVVSRVYVIQRVSVSMYNDSAGGVTLSGGVPKDVPIPDVQSANASTNYINVIAAVNSIVAAAPAAGGVAGGIAPGGTLKFTAVSSRSVSMEEKFPRPVVIGYTGFNVEVTRKQLLKDLKADERIKLQRVSRSTVTKRAK